MNINDLLFQSLGESALGIVIVFAVLILIMVCIKIMTALLNKESEKAEVPATPAAPVVSNAKGSCGEIALHDVPEKTAAMLMAITADKLGEPLNTLRFISIKEVEA